MYWSHLLLLRLVPLYTEYPSPECLFGRIQNLPSGCTGPEGIEVSTQHIYSGLMWCCWSLYWVERWRSCHWPPLSWTSVHSERILHQECSQLVFMTLDFLLSFASFVRGFWRHNEYGHNSVITYASLIPLLRSFIKGQPCTQGTLSGLLKEWGLNLQPHPASRLWCGIRRHRTSSTLHGYSRTEISMLSRAIQLKYNNEPKA